jgi:3-hydroxybutyryl-CoA dehydrogenase
VTWITSRQADTEKLRRSFFRRICRAADNGLLPDESSARMVANTIISNDIGQVAGCDLIIETITEDLSSKKGLFREMDKLAAPETIFTTNSSSIIPSRLIPSPARSSYVSGMHFFYPVGLTNITEIIVHKEFSKESAGKIRTFLDSIGRRYLLLEEPSAFILNRIFLEIQNEAFLLVREGRISYSRLDGLVRDHLFPGGIFEFFDSVGIDTMLASIRNYIENYLNREHYAALVDHLEKMVADGRLGKKSGSGFFDYPGDLGRESNAGGQLSDTDSSEIVDFLRFQFLNAIRRFTVRSGLSLAEMNEAIKEYFSIEKGPFDF